MPEYCQQHINLEEKVNGIDKTLARIESKLENSVEETKKHIDAGSKYRLAIVCACIGLVGMAVGAIVKFAVNDYRVTQHDGEIKIIREQIYDLNYVKGRTEAMSEIKQ